MSTQSIQSVVTYKNPAPDSAVLNLGDAPRRIDALDGWRGVSILLVLAGHMLPLGPKALQLNSMVAAAGLSIFFCLSGFLVVSMLLTSQNIASFAVRRVCRILPLAWLFIMTLLIFQVPTLEVWSANLLFYANLVPNGLLRHGEHLWSLSVEVQFYVFVGLIVAMFGRGGLLLIPVACVVITIARIQNGVEMSNVTWFRADEILAGGTLALVLGHVKLNQTSRLHCSVPVFLGSLLLASCHASFGVLNYLRPYFAALMVFSSLHQSGSAIQKVLANEFLRYSAKGSYALYVIHPLTYAGWLGEGDVVVRYAKRVISFALTFIFAHWSSHYFEKRFNLWGHRIAARFEQRQMP